MIKKLLLTCALFVKFNAVSVAATTDQRAAHFRHFYQKMPEYYAVLTRNHHAFDHAMPPELKDTFVCAIRNLKDLAQFIFQKQGHDLCSKFLNDLRAKVNQERIESYEEIPPQEVQQIHSANLFKKIESKKEIETSLDLRLACHGYFFNYLGFGKDKSAQALLKGKLTEEEKGKRFCDFYEGARESQNIKMGNAVFEVAHGLKTIDEVSQEITKKKYDEAVQHLHAEDLVKKGVLAVAAIAKTNAATPFTAANQEMLCEVDLAETSFMFLEDLATDNNAFPPDSFALKIFCDYLKVPYHMIDKHGKTIYETSKETKTLAMEPIVLACDYGQWFAKRASDTKGDPLENAKNRQDTKRQVELMMEMVLGNQQQHLEGLLKIIFSNLRSYRVQLEELFKNKVFPNNLTNEELEGMKTHAPLLYLDFYFHHKSPEKAFCFWKATMEGFCKKSKSPQIGGCTDVKLWWEQRTHFKPDNNKEFLDLILLFAQNTSPDREAEERTLYVRMIREIKKGTFGEVTKGTEAANTLTQILNDLLSAKGGHWKQGTLGKELWEAEIWKHDGLIKKLIAGEKFDKFYNEILIASHYEKMVTNALDAKLNKKEDLKDLVCGLYSYTQSSYYIQEDKNFIVRASKKCTNEAEITNFLNNFCDENWIIKEITLAEIFVDFFTRQKTQPNVSTQESFTRHLECEQIYHSGTRHESEQTKKELQQRKRNTFITEIERLSNDSSIREAALQVCDGVSDQQRFPKEKEYLFDRDKSMRRTSQATLQLKLDQKQFDTELENTTMKSTVENLVDTFFKSEDWQMECLNQKKNTFDYLKIKLEYVVEREQYKEARNYLEQYLSEVTKRAHQ